jgi:hypothetical protein
MKKDNIIIWLNENSSKIDSMLQIMCGININDGSWQFKVESQFGGGSWCAVDNHKHTILIHIGIHEWLDEDHESAPKYESVLGYKPGEKDLFAVYMDLGMHEFMHACITRTGNTLQQIALGFPMKTPTASKYQKEFYRQNVEKFIHFLHNCVCDARIENIGKNLYNVAQYFDFGRILDYMVADTPGPSKSWNFGYAMLQLGVIGQYPQFDLDPEAIKAIESITKHPVPGSVKTRDLYEEFLCEPHPTISVKKFASWFDVPEFRSYIEKLIFEEIETQSKVADQLAQMLANMPKEVQISGGGSGGGGIPLQLPAGISLKRASNGTKGSGSDDEKDENASGGSGQQSDGDGEKTNGSSAGSNGNQDGEENATSGNAGEGNESSHSTDGDSKSDSSSQNGQSSISDQACEHDKSMENHDTFDENGEWSLSNSDNTDGDVEKLSESNELRDALDSAIKEIGKAAKSTIKKKPNKQTKSTKPTNGSSATVHIDTSFKPQKFAPATIIAAAKPLRAVIKRLQSENQEDEITGLKAGSLNTRALYRYKNRDLSVFKERKLPTIVDAVYYICWDGSGSMCGDKQMESAYACAVIEEAVRGLYPMKIINFSTNPGVVHYIVKDFDDKTKKNAAYSFGAQRYFSGGNKDGFSIRQCTEELIKRKETNKFLIVLSDGAPSDYSSHKEAVDDVRNAVAFARANKIDVTSIFFGSEYERDSQIGLYNEMYGASHIISCEPNEIVNHMVNIVKKNILKR